MKKTAAVLLFIQLFVFQILTAQSYQVPDKMRLQKVEFFSPDGKSVGRMEIEYGPKGVIVSHDTYGSSEKPWRGMRYEYNDSGQLVKASQLFDDDLYEYTVYEYKKNHVTKESVYDRDDKLVMVTLYEYDNKGKPVTRAVLESGEKWKSISLNEYDGKNKLKRMVTYQMGVPVSTSVVENRKDKQVKTDHYFGGEKREEWKTVNTVVFITKGALKGRIKEYSSYSYWLGGEGEPELDDCSSFSYKLEYDKDKNIHRIDVYSSSKTSPGYAEFTWEKGKLDREITEQIIEQTFRMYIGC
ncbi:MAG: hypothetical protein JW969_03545 [Spirochaetales bacterium]|nr:hypothetical protein [Spirochaetales bacterium]